MDKPLTCYFFVPGLSAKYQTGGLMVIRDVADLIAKNTGAECKFVTTHEKHPEALAPGEIFNDNAVYFVTWGPLVHDHIKLIRKHVPDARIIYYAQSFGWGIKVPPKIPIICVSRYVMAQWAFHAQENFCAYIPPPLHACFKLENRERDIDVLVHKRKQNKYCLEKLLPALQREKLRIEIINEWIPQEQFAALLNRAKIFLYVTELHKAGWGRRLPGEGFGLPALEAVACGALVGSNLLGGVTDFLTPDENCIKLQNNDLDFDIEQICKAVEDFQPNERIATNIAAQYAPETVAKKWGTVLNVLCGHSRLNKSSG